VLALGHCVRPVSNRLLRDSTVLISIPRASVGFLTIPVSQGFDVDCALLENGSIMKDICTVQRLSSLASTLFGLTSVTSGIHHTWRHKKKIDAEHDDAVGIIHSPRSRPSTNIIPNSMVMSVI
jgi:hypothetical protein